MESHEASEKWHTSCCAPQGAVGRNMWGRGAGWECRGCPSGLLATTTCVVSPSSVPGQQYPGTSQCGGGEGGVVLGEGGGGVRKVGVEGAQERSPGGSLKHFLDIIVRDEAQRYILPKTF